MKSKIKKINKCLKKKRLKILGKNGLKKCNKKLGTPLLRTTVDLM